MYAKISIRQLRPGKYQLFVFSDGVFPFEMRRLGELVFRRGSIPVAASEQDKSRGFSASKLKRKRKQAGSICVACRTCTGMSFRFLLHLTYRSQISSKWAPCSDSFSKLVCATRKFPVPIKSDYYSIRMCGLPSSSSVANSG